MLDAAGRSFEALAPFRSHRPACPAHVASAYALSSVLTGRPRLQLGRLISPTATPAGDGSPRFITRRCLLPPMPSCRRWLLMTAIRRSGDSLPRHSARPPPMASRLRLVAVKCRLLSALGVVLPPRALLHQLADHRGRRLSLCLFTPPRDEIVLASASAFADVMPARRPPRPCRYDSAPLPRY